MRLRNISILIFFLIGLFPPGVCTAEKIPVVAGIFPIADMVRRVGDRHVTVTVAVPAGASPHTFEPKPSLVKKFSEARLYFMVGAGLETWSAKFMKFSGDRLVTVVLSDGISLMRTISDDHTASKRRDHNGHADSGPDRQDKRADVANPHIWLDPVIAKLMVAKIVKTLSQVDNRHKDAYERNGEIFTGELETLHRLIASRIQQFRTKKYVAFHSAWDYFARRYGLESVGIIETAPGRNPTPRKIAGIIAEIKNYQIRAIFAEPQLNPKVAEVIARQAGVRVLLLDPVGDAGIKGRHTYLDLMNYNLNVLEEAMR